MYRQFSITVLVVSAQGSTWFGAMISAFGYGIGRSLVEGFLRRVPIFCASPELFDGDH